MIPVRKTAEDNLLEFVEEQIEKFRKYSNLGNGQPGYYELNEALMNYSNINCSLIAMDVMAKQELERAKSAFDDFMADKYMSERARLNPVNVASTKWASSKEIEYSVRVNYHDEYSRLYTAMADAEKKVAFLRRLLSAWENQLFVIRQLCKNTEIETIRLGVTE